MYVLAFASVAFNALCRPIVRSLAGNMLCGLYSDGSGTYTAEGIDALCDALKGNNTITSLKYTGHLESIPTLR